MLEYLRDYKIRKINFEVFFGKHISAEKYIKV